MKRKSTLPMTQAEVEPLVKTSITIPRVLMQFAETQLTQEGFNSLSAYLSELVRRDRRDSITTPPPVSLPPAPVVPTSPVKTGRAQAVKAAKKIHSGTTVGQD